MSAIPPWLKFAIGGVVALAAGWVAYERLYASPVRERVEAIKEAKSAAQRLDEQLDEAAAIRRGLRAIASTTLGKKEDLAIARFRDGLTAIAERNGLTGLVVSSGPPTMVPNPALRERISTAFKNRLRARRGDFAVIHGRLKASGPLESALRTLAVVQAQPWAHRVSGFSMVPVGKDREWVELQIDVSTMFVSDLAPGDGEPLPTDPSPGHESVWRTVASKNMFRNPPPRESAPARVVEVSAGPEKKPPVRDPVASLGEWRVAGLIATGSRCEVTLLNTRTGERLTVTAGGATSGATLLWSDGEVAVFEIGGVEYEFLPGQTLAERRPARGRAGSSTLGD